MQIDILLCSTSGICMSASSGRLTQKSLQAAAAIVPPHGLLVDPAASFTTQRPYTAFFLPVVSKVFGTHRIQKSWWHNVNLTRNV